MRFPRLLQLFFILYCVEVGTFLVMFPWSPTWEYRLLAVAPYRWHGVLTSAFTRGGISGFGLVHLVWGFHDLKNYLAKRSLNSGGEEQQ